MKNGKRLKKNQKIKVKEAGLNPENWLIVKNLHNEMHLVHRVSGRIRIIPV